MKQYNRNNWHIEEQTLLAKRWHRKRNAKRVLVAAVLSVASIISLSACGASQTRQNGISGVTKHGGTLTIMTGASEIGFDPAKSQSLPITTAGLIFRKLTNWKVRPNGATELVPDLATDTGKASADGKTWTYTLKKNLKFEDGTPITAQTIKYGLERSFADSLTGGLSYHKTLLKGAENYHGPFEGKSLDSIETPDNYTIIFHLKTAFAHWPWITSLVSFSPVPLKSGSPQTYSKNPVASGPYRIERNETGKQVIFVRNKYWDAKSDTVRTAGPDKIVWKLGQDASVAAQSILQGHAAAARSFLSSFVPPAQLVQAQANPRTRQLLVTSGDGALEYLAINTQRVTNLNVRQAIQYATDKQSYRTAKGGAIAGNFATTLITPGIAQRKVYDYYPASTRGDVAKAKQLLQKSGEKQVSLTLVAKPDQADVASSIQAGLARAGIKVTIKTLDAELFNDAVTGNKGEYDLVISSWQPDFPSAYANLSPLFESSQIGNGNMNLARYRNAQVDDLISRASGTLDKKQADQLWQQADQRIMKDSPVVPLIYSHNTFIHGSQVDNFFVGSFPAYPDYLAMSLR